MTNFMFNDIVGALLALLAWFLLSAVQGLAIGYTSNVFSFCKLSIEKQLGLAIIFATAIFPSIMYLITNLAGIQTALGLDFVLFLFSLTIIYRNKDTVQQFQLSQLWQNYRYLFFVIIGWVIFCLIMLPDVQIGKNLYLPLTIFDHLKHIAVADAISRQGVPPANPFCYLGHAVPLRYYYFWHIGCAVINVIIGSPYNSRPAVLGGVIWIGIVFMATIAFCFRYFEAENRPTKKLAFAAFALIPIANIYFIVVPHFVLVAAILGNTKLLTLNWWTEDQISPFLTSMLWVPHHMAGLIAGLVSSICLLEASQELSRSKRAWLVIFSALAMASCLGCSVYVAIGFVATWVVWVLILLSTKRWREFVVLSICSLLFVFLSSPLLGELWQITSEYAPLVFAVRKFEILDCCFAIPLSKFIQLLYLFFLPINYFCGFGFLLVASLLYWKRNYFSIRQPKELFLLTMFVVSLILGSFIRSHAQNNNDFGWRIFLLAQFALLLWSARFICDTGWLKTNNKFTSMLLKSLLVIGLVSTSYDCFLQRTAGARFNPAFAYNMRSIYTLLDNKIALNAVVQHNPSPLFMGLDPFFALYSHRQTAVSVAQDGVAFAPNKKQYELAESEIHQLFQNIPLSQALAICRRYQINILLMRNIDSIWSANNTWLTKFPIFAGNNNARAIIIDSIPIPFASSVDESSQSKNQ